MNTTGLLAAGVAASLSMATVPHAAAQERSLDEIKKEVMRRAGHINPFEGIRREDAAQVVASLNTLTIDMRGNGRKLRSATRHAARSRLLAAAATISGLKSISSRRRELAASGRRVPCSHCCTVFAGRPNCSENMRTDFATFLRMALIRTPV